MSEFGMRPAIKWLSSQLQEQPVKVAELGVFKGLNAERFLSMLNVQELCLVDLWITPQNLIGKYDYDVFYKDVCGRFKNFPNVTIIKNDTSSTASQYPDEYFDIVYVDADHEYNGCKKDIESWLPKIKKGGYMVGHDYFRAEGVKKAVNEIFSNNEIITFDSIGMYDNIKYGEWIIKK